MAFEEDYPRIYTLIYIFYLLCLSGGDTYFVYATRNKLRPYFAGHAMYGDVRRVNFVFGFLCFVVVTMVFQALQCIVSIMIGGGSDRNKRSKGCLNAAGIILAYCFVVISSIITITYTHDWWKYFGEQGLVQLERLCKAIAGWMMASLILNFILGFCTYICVIWAFAREILSEQANMRSESRV